MEAQTQDIRDEWITVPTEGSGVMLLVDSPDTPAPILDPTEPVPSAQDLRTIAQLLERVNQDQESTVKPTYSLPTDETAVYAVDAAAPKQSWEKDGKGKYRSGPQLSLRVHGLQKRTKRVTASQYPSTVSFFTTAVQVPVGEPLEKDDHVLWFVEPERLVESHIKIIQDDTIHLDYPSYMDVKADTIEGHTTQIKLSELTAVLHEVRREGRDFVLVHQTRSYKTQQEADLCKKRSRPTAHLIAADDSQSYSDDELARMREQELLRVIWQRLREVQEKMSELPEDAQTEVQLTLGQMSQSNTTSIPMRGNCMPNTVSLTQLRVTLDDLLSAWDDLSKYADKGQGVELFVKESVLPLLQSLDPAVVGIDLSDISPLEALENAIQAIDHGVADMLAADMTILAVLNTSHGGIYMCASCGEDSGSTFEQLPPTWKCKCGAPRCLKKPVQSAASKLPPLDLEHEQNVLKKCVRGALPGRQCRIDVMQNPTFEELQDRLLDHRFVYDYIHLAGHGDRNGLFFLKEEDQVPVDSLVDMFAQHSREHARLQAVVFNVCGGFDDDTFEKLLVSGVAVVAAPGPISDKFCLQYANGFYKKLSLGEPNVDEAHCAGLTSFKAATAKDQRPAHGKVPVLYPPVGDEWQWKMSSRRKARQQSAIYGRQQPRSKQQPRSYQTELADKAAQNNTIIFIPTGAGKTMVASILIKRFFERTQKLVLFVVQTIPLVFQQGMSIAADTELTVGRFCGEVGTQIWEEELNPTQNNVVVITSGLLLNLLHEGHCSLNQVSLLIFDECHHTTKRHPFNQILKEFYWTLEEEEDKPHVVGLTASPGGEPSFEHTQERVYTLCLNMKATIITPLEHRDELNKFVHRPEMKLIQVNHGMHEGILLDFLDGFIGVLRSVLLELGFSPCSKEHNEEWRKVLLETSAPSKHAVHFEQSLREASSFAELCGDKGQQFILEQISSCIQAYVSLCEQGPHSGIKAIQHTIEQLNWTWGGSLVGENRGNTRATRTPPGLSDRLNRAIRDSPIYSTIEDGDLRSLAEKTMSPKTTALLECLREYAKSEDADASDRIIVFVQQRDTALFLTDIIQKDLELCSAANKILPARLTGHGKSKQDQGMGHREQEETIQAFRDGKFNLLVATSVAEEGLDIGACNLVIRYDAMTTVTALIQSRGRARHPDSRFVVIYMEGAVEENMLKQLQTQEANMASAVDEIMAGGATDFEQRLEGLKLERKFLQQDAESVLDRYCMRVASESPFYEPSCAGWGAVQSHRCSVTLPLGCDVSRSTICQGEDQSKKADAKQDAAYKACILLHNSGRLVDADVQGCHYFLQAEHQHTATGKADKSQLLEYLQQRHFPPASFSFPTTDDGSFVCKIAIDTSGIHGLQVYTSQDSHSKKKHAEADAARLALSLLREIPIEPSLATNNNSTSGSQQSTAVVESAKSMLNQHLQKQHLPMASYECPPQLTNGGFICNATIVDGSGSTLTFSSQGSHTRKKKAEEDVARVVLAVLSRSTDGATIAAAADETTAPSDSRREPASSVKQEAPLVDESAGESNIKPSGALEECWERLRAVPAAVEEMDELGVEQADDLLELDHDDVLKLGAMLKKVQRSKLMKVLGASEV